MYLQLTADNCKNFNDYLSEKDILYKYQITIARSYIGKYQHEFVAVCTSMCILDFMHNLSCAFLHLSHTHDWDEHSAAWSYHIFSSDHASVGLTQACANNYQTHLVEACRLLTHLTSFIPRPYPKGESLGEIKLIPRASLTIDCFLCRIF